MSRHDRQTQADRDNRSNQLNKNNDAFYTSRGLDERPADWQVRQEPEDKRKP